MKKVFTCSFFIVACCGFFVSCSKDVKAPAKTNRTTMATTSTYDGTQTTSQTPGDHGCGGSYTSSNSGGGH
ncbi:MAG TPA: hypothetical protein VFW07_06835 [Parafilimonas sp.]|nr:hypothetical protein [Parafilimonas sp.]